VDETLQKEPSTLDIAYETLLKEANKEDIQTNDKSVQVGTDLDLLLVDIRVTQKANVHVDFFILKSFFEKIEHHPMFTCLLALNHILRSEIKKNLH